MKKMTQEEKDERLLGRNGWTVECWSPFEIRHEETGSFATKLAAYAVINALRTEYAEKREEFKRRALKRRLGRKPEK